MNRSENMKRIRGKNTVPELKIRSLLWSSGFRYRLYAKELPGRPDIVFRSRRKVIFVHGCFWHRCSKCKNANVPKTNREFWMKKFKRNVEKDKEDLLKLEQSGWDSLIIWECELKNMGVIKVNLRKFLLN